MDLPGLRSNCLVGLQNEVLQSTLSFHLQDDSGARFHAMKRQPKLIDGCEVLAIDGVYDVALLQFITDIPRCADLGCHQDSTFGSQIPKDLSYLIVDFEHQ